MDSSANCPELILLPGMDGTGLLFEPFLKVLPHGAGARVVAYPTNEALGYEELLPRVMAALPREGRYVIVGESFSGPLALMAATAAPAGLEAVVLSASFVRNPVPFIPSFARHFARPWFFRLALIWARHKNRGKRGARSELGALLTRANDSVDPKAWAARARAILAVNALPHLLACPVPILYLQGSRDNVVHASNVQQISQHRRDVRVGVIDCGHLVMQTRPNEARDLILKFLGETHGEV